MSGGAGLVVDAWAALALLQREETAATTVRRYLKRAEAGNLRLLMSLVNLGEVYYRMVQLAGEERADERLRLFRRLPIEVAPAKEAVVMEAARLKAQFPVSYADAFAVATARLEGAAVLTGDPEIVALPRSLVRVVRLRRG